MAYNIGSVNPSRLVDEAGQHRVKNTGPGSCVIAKDPQLSPTAADSFTLAASAEETVELQEGEALFAICPGGQTASLEIF